MTEEKIFTIPLREAYKKSVRKRSPYAMRLVRSFLKTHTKAETVKLGQELNKAIWARGRARPARKVRVKAIKDGVVVKAELIGFEYKDFKAVPKKEKKSTKEKLMERLGPKAMKKEEEEKAAEGKKEESKAEQKEEKKEAKAEASEVKEEKPVKKE